MLKGRISGINSSIYTVDVNDVSYSCSVRGVFRNRGITPLVGDYVDINEQTNQIVKIYDRKNILRRPNIANIDAAIILASVKDPDLDLVLLDKLLVHIIARNIKPIICFSKVDLLDNTSDFLKVKAYYESIGISCIINTEIEKFKDLVSGMIVVTCGQTGAGKSTFINKFDENLMLETNPISKSLNRGVHTTRYVTLYKIDDFYIADTPGFSSLELSDLDEIMIRDAFVEFASVDCKYRDCNHINTDGCCVSANSDILESRYLNYVKFIEEKNEGRSKLFK